MIENPSPIDMAVALAEDLTKVAKREVIYTRGLANKKDAPQYLINNRNLLLMAERAYVLELKELNCDQLAERALLKGYELGRGTRGE